MATDLNSIDVVAGDDILASEYNTLRADLVRRAGDYETAGGSSNAFTLAIDSSIVTSYITGSIFRFKANHSIDGAPTLNVNSLGVKSIVFADGTPLGPGDIINGQLVSVQYDGTSMQMLSPVGRRRPAESWTIPITDWDPINYSLVWNDVGFSDDPADRRFTVAGKESSQSQAIHADFSINPDTGVDVPIFIEITPDTANISGTIDGAVNIGGDFWYSDDGQNETRKNGSTVTVSGTERYGPLGHDPNNDYLLVQYSTTLIARFSGIAGSTITNLASDITLDTAVTQGPGFAYDAINDEFFFLDKTNNYVRRFDGSGTTIETIAYTFDDQDLWGLAFIDHQLYAIISETFGVSTDRPGRGIIQAVPLNFRRSP